MKKLLGYPRLKMIRAIAGHILATNAESTLHAETLIKLIEVRHGIEHASVARFEAEQEAKRLYPY